MGWDPSLVAKKGGGGGGGRGKKSKKQQQQQGKPAPPQPGAAATAPGPTSMGSVTAGVAGLQVATEGGGDNDDDDAGALARRVKALQKRLRQIEALEAQMAGGGELTPEQREKVGRKGMLREELGTLQAGEAKQKKGR